MDGSVTLDEQAARTSFNPEGTPYGGLWDSDEDDEYPSIITGLIYADIGQAHLDLHDLISLGFIIALYLFSLHLLRTGYGIRT